MTTKSFAVSEKEINRRIGAFFSLAISWPAILACTSLFLPAEYRIEALTLAIAILAMMLIMGVLTALFLRKSHLHTTFKLTNNSFERIVNSRVKDRVDLGSVTHIHTKYVATGAIRQITLTDTNKHKYNIDGVEEFEPLRAQLTRLCSVVPVSNWREPINYDHVLFYPSLGLILSAFSVLLVMIMSSTAGSVIGQFLTICVTLFCFGVAVYIIITKPFVRQYGLSARKADWILAISLAAGATLAAILAM
jgi:hypothetical protein